jgi:hypothetical protein
MEQAVLEFCKTREAVLEMTRNTSTERAELREAHKTLTEHLRTSMQANEVDCVRVASSNAPPVYLKLTKETRRAAPMRTVEEALELVHDVACHVTHVATEDLPDAIARLVEARARERGTVVPPRLQIVPRVGVRQKIVEHTYAGDKIATLAAQMEESHVARHAMQERVRPLRKTMKRMEQSLVAQTDAPVPVDGIVVAMTHAPVKDVDAPPKQRTVRVFAETVRKRARTSLGIRHVCECVRSATAKVVGRGDSFDAQLQTHVKEALSPPSDDAQEETVTRIKVRRQALVTTPPPSS